MDLDAQLNKGFVLPYQTYPGSIPMNVPAMTKDKRVFAGGNVVLGKRLDALQSQDKERISGWGGNYFDLADLGLVLEDLVKLQPDSPLLKGIIGVVETKDGNYVAIDARAVEAAVTKGKYRPFENQLSKSETANYLRDGEELQETVSNVILFPYDGSSIKLNPDQFNAVNAKPIKRKDMIHDREMKEGEIVKDGKVIHPAWKIYHPKTIVPLVRETFKCNKKAYDFDTNMGLYLPGEPQNNAEGRALCVDRLGLRSRLDAWDILGGGGLRSVGVALNVAEGDAQKSEYRAK